VHGLTSSLAKEYLSLWRHPSASVFAGGGGGRESLPEGAVGSSDRLLVCQPTFGLGNRINALILCQALALATRRRMLVHWNCAFCHDQVTISDYQLLSVTIG
jgi:hypothetical protein